MSRPKVRVPVEQLRPGEQALERDAAHYVHAVRRLRPGDRFVAFDPLRALEAEAVVVRASTREVVVEAEAPVALVRRPGVVWMQGIAKGDKMDAIVRDATELGATRIVPLLTEFTVVKLEGARSDGRHRRWERIAREAARQCGRADVPTVDAPIGWGRALEREGARFCLYERAAKPLGPGLLAALDADGAVVFAAGPEGGLSEKEVDAAARAGFDIVSLGELVLRTETVAAATLGALIALRQACSSVPIAGKVQ